MASLKEQRVFLELLCILSNIFYSFESKHYKKCVHVYGTGGRWLTLLQHMKENFTNDVVHELDLNSGRRQNGISGKRSLEVRYMVHCYVFHNTVQFLN